MVIGDRLYVIKPSSRIDTKSIIECYPIQKIGQKYIYLNRGRYRFPKTIVNNNMRYCNYYVTSTPESAEDIVNTHGFNKEFDYIER